MLPEALPQVEAGAQQCALAGGARDLPGLPTQSPTHTRVSYAPSAIRTAVPIAAAFAGVSANQAAPSFFSTSSR